MDEFTNKYFMFLFFPMWFAAVYFGGFLSGWTTLANKYKKPADKHSNGKTVFLSSFWTGMMHYGNCVFMSADKDGLYLSVLFFFRFGHAPLFIPWSEINATYGKYFFFFNTVDLVFKASPNRVYRLFESPAKKAGVFEFISLS